MPKVKFTMLINAGTADAASNVIRNGGFSESWYSDLTFGGSALDRNWRALVDYRAALLPSNARVIGERLQQVDPVGPSRTYEVVRPGVNANQNDLPQMCLHWNMRSGGGANRRLVTLRGVPDARVVNGEYRSDPTYDAALQRYFGELEANWLMKGRVRTNEKLRVVGVTAPGVCTTVGDHGLEAGDAVIFLRTRNVNGVLTKGVFYVEQALTANTFSIAAWPVIGNGVITKGFLRQHEEEYFSVEIEDAEVLHPDAATRKVGSPFNRFRGKASAKR